jgi:hypothetical protein
VDEMLCEMILMYLRVKYLGLVFMLMIFCVKRGAL